MRHERKCFWVGFCKILFKARKYFAEMKLSIEGKTIDRKKTICRMERKANNDN